MSEVKLEVPLPVKRRAMGKQKLPPERRRVILSVRVLPATLSYINGMKERSAGKAIDMLVKAMQHPGILRAMEAGAEFGIVNLAG